MATLEDHYKQLKDVQYSFFCTRELAEKFEAWCETYAVNKSAFFRSAIKKAVEE